MFLFLPATDEEVVAFDKEHLTAQIQAGGSYVLDEFDLAKVSMLNTFTHIKQYMHMVWGACCNGWLDAVATTVDYRKIPCTN